MHSLRQGATFDVTVDLFVARLRLENVASYLPGQTPRGGRGRVAAANGLHLDDHLMSKKFSEDR